MARTLKPIRVDDNGAAGPRPSPNDRPTKASPDPSKAGSRENLNTTFGKPNEDK